MDSYEFVETDRPSSVRMLSSLPDLAAGILRPYRLLNLLSVGGEGEEVRQLRLNHLAVEGEVVEGLHQPKELEGYRLICSCAFAPLLPRRHLWGSIG